MARENGSYREGYFATIAAANTALDTFVTAIDTRLDVDGTQAVKASGSITMNVLCEDGGGNQFTHKGSITFDTGTVAVGVALTDTIAVITALDAFMTAAEGASAYTTVLKVDVTANISMNN